MSSFQPNQTRTFKRRGVATYLYVFVVILWPKEGFLIPEWRDILKPWIPGRTSWVGSPPRLRPPATRPWIVPLPIAPSWRWVVEIIVWEIDLLLFVDGPAWHILLSLGAGKVLDLQRHLLVFLLSLLQHMCLKQVTAECSESSKKRRTSTFHPTVWLSGEKSWPHVNHFCASSTIPQMWKATLRSFVPPGTSKLLSTSARLLQLPSAQHTTASYLRTALLLLRSPAVSVPMRRVHMNRYSYPYQLAQALSQADLSTSQLQDSFWTGIWTLLCNFCCLLTFLFLLQLSLHWQYGWSNPT